MLVIAHVLAGVLAACATYDPYSRRDVSFILQKAREGEVSEATLVVDEQRISVSTINGQKWYAHYGLPGLSQEALMEELGRADPGGNIKVTVVNSVWGMSGGPGRAHRTAAAPPHNLRAVGLHRFTAPPGASHAGRSVHPSALAVTVDAVWT
ncbi:hypothetical protein [Nonomuraea bangladeshensis]|uniref:hypothetical protein n=1 Tax=Nonomuraea bangladeshensis TaxID=404385 RepID=UPI003C2FD684